MDPKTTADEALSSRIPCKEEIKQAGSIKLHCVIGDHRGGEFQKLTEGKTIHL